MKVDYDVGNSFNQKYDIYKEIVWLGKDRVCQLHIKDNPHYLGKGDIDMPKYVEAVLKSGFEGWAVLETSSPAKNCRPSSVSTTNLCCVDGATTASDVKPLRPLVRRLGAWKRGAGRQCRDEDERPLHFHAGCISMNIVRMPRLTSNTTDSG